MKMLILTFAAVGLTLLAAVPAPAAASAAGFTDHGVAVPISMCRGLVVTADRQGRDIVLIQIMDRRGGYGMLQIDAASGKSDLIRNPYDNKGDSPFTSLLSSRNKFYTHYGSHFVEYDPDQKAYTACHANGHRSAMAMCEDARGVIWSAVYPDAGLVSYDPATQTFTDHGAINLEEWPQYPRSLQAGADGWIYIGIGNTQGQIVAYHPPTRKTVKLIPEKDRANPSNGLVFNHSDGKTYGKLNTKGALWYELIDGGIRPAEPAGKIVKSTITDTQNLFHDRFPSGRVLRNKDLLETRRLQIADADGGNPTTVVFDYQSEGSLLMGVELAPDRTIRGGSHFPMRLASLDLATGAMSNRSISGLQLNTTLSHHGSFYIGAYNGGHLLKYRPELPWTWDEDRRTPHLDTNPVYYGSARPAVGRPHALAATPDDRFLIMAGTPDYGYTGGGLALLETATGQLTVIPHTELAVEEAPYSLAVLSNDLLLIGTATQPGTGGQKKAKDCSLLLFDLKAKQTIWRDKPFPGLNYILDLKVLPDGGVIGANDLNELFRFDLVSRKITATASHAGFGVSARQQGPKLFLHDGTTLYFLLATGIAKVDPVSCQITEFAKAPTPVSNGGALAGGRLYFASTSHIWSFDLSTPGAFSAAPATADLNGDFARLDGELPAGWAQNKGNWNQPWGESTVLKGNDGNQVKISAGAKATWLYTHQRTFPVKTGDRIELEITAAGRGSGQFGIYGYTAANKSLYVLHETVKLEPGAKTYRHLFTIPENDKGDTAYIRLSFGAAPNSEVVVSAIKLLSPAL